MTTTQQSSADTILDQLYVCKVDLRTWTGQVQADTDNDYKVGVGGRMPSKKVVQAGRKFIVNPETLSPFSRIRSQVRRDLDRVGFPFLGGWGIPLDRKDELDEILDSIVSDFEYEKSEFIANYKDNSAKWISDNPDDAEIISRGVIDVKDIDDRFDARVKRFCITPTSEEDKVEMNNEVAGLGNDLMSEISQQAFDIYNKNFIGKDKVSSTVSKTFKGIRDKLHGLSFLNGKFVHVVSMLDHVIAGCGFHRERGMLVAPFIYEVMAVLSIISDQKMLEQFVDGLISIDSVEADLNPDADVPEEEPEVTEDMLTDFGDDSFDGQGESSISTKSNNSDNGIMACF